MHIVTASDDNYAIGVFVLVASAHRHNPQARFSVLATGWSAQNVARFQALIARLGCAGALINVHADRLAALPVRRTHLTNAAFARLLIPDLLPDTGRVIYMDSDMVVTGALDAAWQAPLDHLQLLAAVPCPSPSDLALTSLDLVEGEYFNSGFLVFDPATWKAADLAAECIARLRSDKGRYVSEDESALNDLCRGRVLTLPSGLNFYAQEASYQPALNQPRSIRVIHYVTAPKPWQGRAPLGAIWHAEAARISDLLPPVPPRPVTLRKRLSRFNGVRKLYMGWALRRARYRDALRIRRFVRGTLVPGYLARGGMADVPLPAPLFRKPE